MADRAQLRASRISTIGAGDGHGSAMAAAASRRAILLAMLVTSCSRRPESQGPSKATPLQKVGVAAETSMRAAFDAVDEAGGPPLSVEPLALPGARAPAFLDYIAYEPANRRVWVPVPSSGSVDVLSIATGQFVKIDGWKTTTADRGGQMRTRGPSAVTIGEGVAYVGNRATSDMCSVDVQSLQIRVCVHLPAAIDGVVYVGRTKQVWVTMPAARSIAVLDAPSAGALVLTRTFDVPGQPEGYAVDDAHGLFYTNLEDRDATLAVDVAEVRVRATWKPACGPEGPRGLAFDADRGWLVVACTDHLQVVDTAHGGELKGRLDTGAGLDNVDFLASKRLVYAAAGRAARLTIAYLDNDGQLQAAGTAATAEGARNAVADNDGTAYVADSQHARLLVVRAVNGGSAR
jgi:hypothetical protein